MDMDAYIQIDAIKPLVEQNNIKVDRVRGYRLMKDELPVNKESLDELIESIVLSRIDDFFSMRNDEVFGRVLCFDKEYEEKKQKYLNEDGTVKWDILDAETKKNIDIIQKEVREQVETQYNLWNKFAQKPDVLYIHAKLGSSNWSDTYHKSYEEQPWYLGSCDDTYDAAYCDIYAKLEG